MIWKDRILAGSWRPTPARDILSRFVLGVVILLIILPTARVVYSRIRGYNAFRLAHNKYGCQKPGRYPHTDPLGLDLVRERQVASQAGRQMAHYDEFFAKLGHTWEENLAGQRLINTIDTTNIQYILTQTIDVFGRAGAFHKNSFLGPGIFSSDGPRWKFSRDIIKPLFTKAELSDTKMYQKHVNRLIALIPRDGKFIFGESTDSLLPNSPFSDGKFIEAFNYANAGSLKRRKAGILAIQYCLDREYPKAIAKVYAFIDRHVQRVLTNASDADEKSERRHVLLDELAKRITDPIALRYECLNLFAPGRDAIAILIANALFRLSRKPSIWQELRASALALGEEPELDFEVLKALKPFRNVINETLRSTGPSARIVRTAYKDTMLPKGGGSDGAAPVFVEKGDQVAIMAWGSNHNKEIWGADSYEFKLDRWDHPKSPWEFVPFGGGRRICPAIQQCLVQAIYVLVRLTLEFESIENRDPIQEYVEFQRNLTESRNGVKIGLTAAKVLDRT